jgi:hypothetical protein
MRNGIFWRFSVWGIPEYGRREKMVIWSFLRGVLSSLLAHTQRKFQIILLKPLAYPDLVIAYAWVIL